MITTDSILETFKIWVEEKKPIDAHLWIDGAQKLNILIGDEHDKLFDLMQNIAHWKVYYLAQNLTVANAKIQVEAKDEYKLMLRQKAKIGQIEEMIRIAKIQARLKDNEYRNQ